MKYRSLLLHTCWSISFGCWNSNSNLSSIYLYPFQTQTLIPKPFSSSYPTPFPFSARRPLPAQQAAAAQPSTTASRAARQPLAGHLPVQLAQQHRRPASPLPRPKSLTGGARVSSLPPRRARPRLGRGRAAAASPTPARPLRVARTPRRSARDYLRLRRPLDRPTRDPPCPSRRLAPPPKP
jgi:hypothetical protein